MDAILPVQRSRNSFNSGWSFTRGDGPNDPSRLTYEALRDALLPCARYLRGAASLHRTSQPPDVASAVPEYAHPNFDDAAWRRLQLPHDWAIEGPFDIALPGETGKLPWTGVGWYRKHFEALPLSPQERLVLEVDGAMSFSTFWLNGKLIGGWPYGYTSFQLDLTNALDPSGHNVLAVRLNNPENSSRWYPGAGLYRNLWLTRTHAIHVAPQGLFVHTPRIRPDTAVVNVDLVLENDLDTDVEVTVKTTLVELELVSGKPFGTPIELPEARCQISANNRTQRTVCTTLKTPKCWTPSEPQRYQVTTRLYLNDAGVDIEVDTVVVAFGFRQIEVDAERGFLLNGEHVPIKGVCMHHDQGALGTAISIPALRRQIEILQSMGCNSIRTSHNPPAPELLTLCDEMGILLMVEAFDCWRRGKKQPEGRSEGDPGFSYFDYAAVFDDWHEVDVRAMVRQSRNHPSVVMYSIGNEVIEQWYADGWQIATQLAGIVREEDRTRPITAGCNGEIAAYRGFQTAVDIIGLNYKPVAYTPLRDENPTLPMLSSESASCISTRGEYFFPISDDKSQGQVDFQVSSYDLSAPPWAFPPDVEFRGLDEAPFVAGEYVWTGFDYLGEPTPYNSDSTNLLNYSTAEEREIHRVELERLGKIAVPSRSSYFGIIDLAGFPKDRFYIYQARWRPDLPMAHILPHWTWPERTGQVTPVHVYSTGDEAELFLNGVSQGKRQRKAGEYRFRWDEVVYQPGELEVKTTRQGKPWASAATATAGAAVALHCVTSQTELLADGTSLAFVTIRVVDAKGRVVPRSQPLIACAVEGAGELIAMDNGDPTSLDTFSSSERKAHQGLLLAIVRSMRNVTGPIRLRVTSGQLAASELVLNATA